MKLILNWKRHHYMTRVSIFLLIIALIAGMTGCGANRPAANAIKIQTWYDLYAIGNNMSANYILENDLDATTAGYEELAGPTADGGKGWKPIVGVNESQPEYFTGVFDGQGHKIKDLFINRPDEHLVGLFYNIALFSVIRNVGLVNATVTGGEVVGALVAQATTSTVSNCYFTGTVTGSDYVGGLVGDIWYAGTVTNCYATGSVNGGNFAGGLVGQINDGTVTGSYCTGSVTGSICVGGLVGENYYSTAVVSYSYSTGSAAGNNMTGGLVGLNTGNVIESYATGGVTGNNMTGGLVGYNWWGVVTDSYSTGSVVGNYSIGGLVGYFEAGTVSNSFWDMETSGQGTSDGGTGENTTQMQDIATFSGASWNVTAVANAATRNPSYIWNIVDDATYPFLSWQAI